ncbi:MAG: hypothetical protein JNL47_10895 [Bacteroidia bacterium]|nr:hypothetical protein [Bacteroidia bacterium]
MKPLTILLASVMIMTIAGCYYDIEEELYPNATACDTSGITYSGTVSVIMQQNCLSCHSAASAQGNVVLATYNDVKNYAQSGALAGAINHSSGFSPMPKGGNKLKSCDIRKIELWIASGIPNN